VSAESYLLPHLGRDSVIGAVGVTTSRREDTLADLARRFDVGYDEIVKANPGVDRWVPGAGTRVIIPSQFVLPDAPHEGIVLNLAELRLYYFPPSEGGEAQPVYTYPVSIGRMDWKSPLGRTQVARKEKDPQWCPTQSIREEHAAQGDILPQCIPGGVPENPLGHFALRLALPHYLIHGTDESKEFGIGMRVTHGCIRLYPEDIEQLYSLVSAGTPVRIVDQPIKVGWKSDQLFIEVHSALEEDTADFEEYSHRIGLSEAVDRINEARTENLSIDFTALRKIVEEADGMPASIARTRSLLPPAR